MKRRRLLTMLFSWSPPMLAFFPPRPRREWETVVALYLEQKRTERMNAFGAFFVLKIKMH